MIKVLIASDSFLPRWDGIARFLDDCKGSLPFDVHVVAPAFQGTQSTDVCTRIPLSRFTFADYPFAKRRTKTIRELVQDADVVWTHTLGVIGTTAIKEANKAGKPVTSFIHSLEWELFPKSLAGWNPFRMLAKQIALQRMRTFYNMTSLLMVPSQEVKELLDYRGIHAPMQTISLGIKTKLFVPPEDKKDAKRAIGLNENKTIIGYVGRLSREKDILTLVKAFKRVRTNHNICLLVVGDGLLSIKEKLTGPGIIHVGQQNDVIKYLQAMDIFVLPSLTETTSLSTLEAMSCGVIPVCTQVGLIKEYVAEKTNGMLFPKKNDFVLSLKLEWLLNNPQVMRKLSQHARQTVLDEYNWSATLKAIAASLQDLHNQYADRTKVLNKQED